MGPTLWKWNPHMMVGHTMILPNKRVSVRENAQKRVLLAFLLKLNYKELQTLYQKKYYKLSTLC